MRGRRWLLRALGAVALCGGAGCADEPNTRTLTVVGTEMAFAAPDRVDAGRYDVTFRNEGAEPHELAFRDPSGEFVMRRSIGPGTSVMMNVELEPGTWELGCFEPGHYDAGMHKQLRVS